MEPSRIIEDTSLGVGILELCQALIRYQDYEIFQPGFTDL